MGFNDTINTGTTANDGQGAGLRTNMRKLHDNTKYNKQRLDDLNGNTPGVVSSNEVTILNPIDGTFSVNSIVTGALKISLPQGYNLSMIDFEIRFFNLIINKSFTCKIFGYLYSPLNKWDTTSVQIITSSTSLNLPVRFGHDGIKACIYIGELNTVFDYPKLKILNFTAGYQNYEPSKWLTGWNISVESSSFQNITQTHTNNLPVAQ